MSASKKPKVFRVEFTWQMNTPERLFQPLPTSVSVWSKRIFPSLDGVWVSALARNAAKATGSPAEGKHVVLNLIFGMGKMQSEQNVTVLSIFTDF